MLNPGSGASIKEIDEWSGTCKTTDISRCGVGDDRVAAAVCGVHEKRRKKSKFISNPF